MFKTTRSGAEERLQATQKKAKQSLKQQDKLRQEKADRSAKLRALRLARDVDDSGQETVAADTSEILVLPKVHRQHF